MTSVAETLIADAAQAAPDSPVLEVAAAAAKTVEDPSPVNILNDVELIIDLVKQLHGKLNGLHPTILTMLKALL